MYQITGITDPEKIYEKFNFKGAHPFNNPDLIGDVVSRLLIFAIVSAGLFFFLKLLSSGFTFLTSTGDPAKIQSATKELLNATIGLLVIISSFFIIQIIEIIFGIRIV